MDFSFTEEQKAIKRTAREFALKEIASYIREWDRDESYPGREITAKMGALGFTGGAVPEKYGGSGMDYVSLALMTQGLAYVDNAAAVVAAYPSCSAGQGILSYGSEEQKMNFLAPLARGEVGAATALTEPHSGTDIVRRVETTVTRDGDDYVITGTKMWISALDWADWFITYAALDKSLSYKGLCAFIVETKRPGVSWHSLRNLLGVRTAGANELILDGVRVSKEHRVGNEFDGYKVLLSGAEVGRISCSARALGKLEACIDASVSYAQERIVFGQPIGRYQLVQAKITDMVVGYEAASLLTYRLAWLKDHGVEKLQRDAAIAKLLATDVLMKAAVDAVQIHGAYGVSDEYSVGRHFRDAKVLQIADGTNEIQRVLIAEHALGYRRA